MTDEETSTLTCEARGHPDEGDGVCACGMAVYYSEDETDD